MQANQKLNLINTNFTQEEQKPKIKIWIKILVMELPISKTIQIKRKRHAGHCWRSKGEIISNVPLLTPARGVMVIVVGNGHGDTSSNPGRDWLHFT